MKTNWDYEILISFWIKLVDAKMMDYAKEVYEQAKELR